MDTSKTHRIAIVRREDKSIDEWKDLLQAHGFAVDQKNPTIVFSIGGDGTFLIAERAYPSIPKVLIRESKICVKCHDHPTDHIIESIQKNTFHLDEFHKLEASFQGKKLLGVNDIVLRNHWPTSAIRFTIHGNNLPAEICKELIGDGFVLATTFGASGYFYSITKKIFPAGFGIAWNNLTTTLPPFYLPIVDLAITLHRGEGIVAADNNHDMIHLHDGDTFHIATSAETAKIIRMH